MDFVTIQIGLVCSIICIGITICANSARARIFGKYFIPYYRVRDLAWLTYGYTASIRTEVDQCRSRLIAIEASIQETREAFFEEETHRQDLVNRIEEIRRLVSQVSDYYWQANDDQLNNLEQQRSTEAVPDQDNTWPENQDEGWPNTWEHFGRQDERDRAANWAAEVTDNNGWPDPDENRWSSAPANNDWPEPGTNNRWPGVYEDFNGDESYRHPDSPIPGLLFLNQEGLLQETGTRHNNTPLLLPNDEIRASGTRTSNSTPSSSRATPSRSPAVIEAEEAEIDLFINPFRQFEDLSSSSSSETDRDADGETDSSEEEDELVDSE